MTPPSELIRPPSKAAVIFLRWTTGKQNGRRLSSVMAGVACLDPGKGLASATESYARSKAYATSATPNPNVWPPSAAAQQVQFESAKDRSRACRSHYMDGRLGAVLLHPLCTVHWPDL